MFSSESSGLLPPRASSRGDTAAGNQEETSFAMLDQQEEHTATEESVEVIRTPSDDVEEETENSTADIRQEGAVTQLTRRLRCLFRTLTSPIIPLATILAVALLWVLYAAFILDLRKPCSRPLHAYAVASLVFVAYASHHQQVRNYLFSYSPERNGPPRPIAVRMYDQLYHTLCILYVYGGVTLIEACVEDTGNDNDGNDAIDVIGKDSTTETDGALGNTCAATCPNLYQALSIYVTTLELFTFSLILPLLFLPCVYLWIIRRASEEAEAFSQFQDRMEEEEALLNNGGLTAQAIMDSLEKVKLVSTNNSDVVLVSVSADEETVAPREGAVARECCICMSEFTVHQMDDLESGISAPTEANNNEHNIIVRTKCRHLFHGSCLSGWLGGRWEPNRQESSERSQRRARRTACPLCREDLKPARDS